MKKSDAPESVRGNQAERSSDHVLATKPIEQLLRQRIQALKAWLEQAAPRCTAEQRHLEEGTVERIYWHYGYLVALQDALDLIKSNSQVLS